MHFSSPPYSWALAACFSILGCQPSIGDSCTTNADCSLTGDRLCDPTPPGGYCTQFNCLPGKCPDEAACVGFYTKLASECTMVKVPDQRFERSFCMKKCESDSDCRASEGYACLAPGDLAGISAAVLEDGETASTKVCMASAPVSKGGATENAICEAPPADAAVSTPDGATTTPADAATSDGSARRDASVPDGAPVGDAAAPDGGARDAGRDGSSDARVAP